MEPLPGRLGNMNDEIEVFLNKVDAFAQGLDETEQAMLAHLIRDEPEDDVEGFNFFEAWPQKVIDIAPRKIESFDSFLSSGHATGSNVMGSKPGKGTG